MRSKSVWVLIILDQPAIQSVSVWVFNADKKKKKKRKRDWMI